MRIPLYQDIGHGLLWTPTELVWVTVTRTGEEVAVSVVERESRTGTDRAALERLVDRVEPSPPVVATHVDASNVRHLVETMDAFSAIDSWTDDHVRRSLPPGVSPEAFLACAEPLDDTNTPRTLIAMTRADAVRSRRELLEDVGLTVISITDIRLHLGLAYSAEPVFYDERSYVLSRLGNRDPQSSYWWMSYEHGHIASAPKRAGSNVDDIRLMIEPSDLLFVDGAESPSAHAGAEFTYTETGLEPIADAKDPAGQEPRIPSAAGIACAMTHLYAEAVPYNFLDDVDRDVARETHDRSEALPSMLYAGGLVALLLFLVTVATMGFDYLTQQADASLQQMQTDLRQVRAAEENRDALIKRYRQSRALMHRRTQSAALLERTGKTLPENAWLQRLQFSYAPEEDASDRSSTVSNAGPSPQTRSPVRIRLRGYATEQHLVARYLAALEQDPQLRAVRLGSTERMSGDDLKRETAADVSSAYRFALSARHQPTATP